jgi:hypothetical protein
MSAINDPPVPRFIRLKYASAVSNVHQGEELLFKVKGGATAEGAQASAAGQGTSDFQGGSHQDPLVGAHHVYRTAGHFSDPLRSGEVFVQLIATF